MDYFKVKDIQKILGVSERTIRRYIRDEKLIGFKVGGEWRFTEEQVKELFNEKEVSNIIAKEASKDVQKFLSGEYKSDTDISICTIIDLNDKSENEINVIKENLKDIATSVTVGNYSVKLISDEDKTRITVIGDISSIQKVLNMIGGI